MTQPERKAVKFLYIDERYMDNQSPSKQRVASLTGLLIGADTYGLFRDRFFRILPGFAKGIEVLNMEVHAADLFRQLPDSEHFAFYQGLVSIVNDLGCRIYRRGFNYKPGDKRFLKAQKVMHWYCFRSMLIAAVESEENAQIWPVIEMDSSEKQDESFAGYIRRTDHATAYLQMIEEGVRELIDGDYMVDNAKVGDLHYVSKKSIGGNAVDCLTYLLHCKWLRDNDYPLSKYKGKLADIAHKLNGSLLCDRVATYHLHR